MNVHMTIEKAISQLQKEKGAVFTELIRRGTMRVAYNVPTETDQQKPHTQDEIYVIASGQATLYREGHRSMCFTGDVLFVAAGMQHRFEKMSHDFATWVLFYGPEGNESPSDKLP